MSGSDAGTPGQMTVPDMHDDFTTLQFSMEQLLARVETAGLVMVTAVQPGATGPVGLCTIQHLVNRVNGAGGSYPRGTVSNVPYLRLQGGANAIILDPAVGDKGIALFCSRDISTVKQTKAQSNPGSYRRFDQSDALYLGGVLNGAPTNWVEFGADGIHVHVAAGLKIFLEGDVVITGNITHTGTFNSNAHDIGSDHRHTSSGGSGTGGPPV
jgi:Phage protein Gp138 N-terminal domain